MPESPTEMMEKIRLVQMDNALHNQSIIRLEENDTLQWKVIEGIKDSLATMNARLSALGVVNTIVLAWIVYKLTKGV